MSSRSTTYSSTLPRPTDVILQALTAILGGTALFVILLSLLLASFEVYYAGKIYPGVSAVGIDLSGKKPAEAAAMLAQQLQYPQGGRILLRDGEKIWLSRPADLGFYLDPETTAMLAYQSGRQGGMLSRLSTQLSNWFSGNSIAPQYVFDQRVAQSFLTGIAQQNDLQTIDATLRVEGVNVVVQPGQIGRKLDVESTLASLDSQLRSLSDGEVALQMREEPPAILDAEEQASLARRILSAPLVLKLQDAGEDGPGPWTFQPEQLAGMLTIERISAPEGDRYQVGLETSQLKTFLQGVAPELLRQPQNAKFIFNDETRQLEVIQNAIIGRALDIEASITSINEKLLAGEHEVALAIDTTEPQLPDSTKGADLGITELVASNTSYFYGSSASRIQNIKTAAANFHGIMVPPGGVFSMAEVLGDVSLDNGYAEALIIYGDRTIKGVGGGVCQVSTTLFRTVFFGGFPVIERYPHAYRVYYYEKTANGSDPNLAGLDATVFVPLVDFKFQNDTPYWMLMETYVNPTAGTLTWKFYSTSDGRTVEWGTTGLQNVEEAPEPLYEENPDFPKGKVEQVDWEVEGADVTVSRRVLRGGELLYDDRFTTHYLPWRAVYQYGPGTKDMPPDDDKKKDNDE